MKGNKFSGNSRQRRFQRRLGAWMRWKNRLHGYTGFSMYGHPDLVADQELAMVIRSNQTTFLCKAEETKCRAQTDGISALGNIEGRGEVFCNLWRVRAAVVWHSLDCEPASIFDRKGGWFGGLDGHGRYTSI